MSLIKRGPTSARRRAANQRNGKRSRGPRTAQGRARQRTAHLQHGMYSQSDRAVLKALGEDPEEFGKMLEGLQNPATAFETAAKQLGERLARALQLMRRSERAQEGLAPRAA